MPVARSNAEITASWLVVATTRRGEPVYEAGWRHRNPDGTTRTMKRRIGPAWLQQSSDGFVRRRGRVHPDFYDEHAAIVAKDRIVRDVETQLAREHAEAELAAHPITTFRWIAAHYMNWLVRVRDAKPSTLRDHRYLLAEPGALHRRGGGASPGLIMRALGDRPAEDITTRDIEDLLNQVAATGASSRTINKHRQLICAIYNYATKPSAFGLRSNPATAADRRQEPERARLDYYSPLEIEQLAVALEHGRHRDGSRQPVTTEEQRARADEDRQDAELIRIAAFTGLRRGELVALKWRDVELASDRLIVRRAISADEEATSTKSRRAREVPIPAQAAGPLRRLASRSEFVGADDFVFVSRLGRRLDASALRRRFERAREAAGLRDLRFHDLRHTYGSLLVAGGVDLAAVKAAMGHSRITTTERYLHARPAHELAHRFTHAFGT